MNTYITMEWPASQAAEKLAAYEPLRQAIAAAETPSPPA